MNDAVFDTTVVAFANADIAKIKPATSQQRRFTLLKYAVAGNLRIRYNGKLLTEYEQHVRLRRNDVIELFFALLDSTSAVRVYKNTLSRQDHGLAVAHRWPRHDEHLLAAALNGHRPCIYVTEARLSDCAPGVHRIFRIHVHLV
jgi:hypothetical protein